MNNFADFSDSLEKLADLQKQGFEPVRQIAGVAVETFEKVARQNYAFAGDVLEFAVSQARLPMDVSEPKAMLERQIASTKAFAELLGARANEYVELGKDFQETTSKLLNTDVVEPARKARKKAA